MPSSSATARIEGSEIQPSCFCTSHSTGTTADCCLPAGKLAIQPWAAFSVALLNSKLAGWLGESLRTLTRASLAEIHAGDLAAGEGVDGDHLEGLGHAVTEHPLVVDDRI